MASKEELNEIRAVGKGSRGGKGAWARRHPGKVFTRRPTDAESIRSETAIELMLANISSKKTALDRSRLSELLTKEYQFSPREFGHESSFWDAILNHKNRMMVRDANTSYVRAIVLIYAIYEWVCSDGEMESHIRMIAEKAKIRITPNTNLLAVIARLVICYDETWKGQGGKVVVTHDRRALSRDVRAIEGLKFVKKWPPHKVLENYSASGGGVDEWSRLPVPGRRLLPKQIHNEVERKKRLGREKDRIDYAYFDDDDGDNEASKGAAAKEAALWAHKKASNGDDMTALGVWENHMLRYCVEEMKLEHNQVILIAAIGNNMVPLGASLISSEVLGETQLDANALKRDFGLVVTAARRLIAKESMPN